MRFRLLGPVEVWSGSRQLALRGPLQRGLLALLAMHANRVVATGQLIEPLWQAAAPDHARGNLRWHVWQLRRTLAEGGDSERLECRAPGYRLRVAPGELDLDEFQRLADEGRHLLSAGDAQAASRSLGAAVGLWRGRALEDVALAGLGPEATRLEERHVAVLEDRIEADLRCGRHGELLVELEALAATRPLRERLHGQLMVALYRSARQPEALAVYRELRTRMVEELGLEPGPELQRLERSILARDPSLRAPSRMDAHQPAVPCQLPADLADFTGRSAQLAEVAGLLAESRQRRAVVVSALAGRGGVGKTALAVHLAHRLRDRFPDGQLFVNLRGVEASPADPAEVLARFLRSLGVDATRIPDGLEERAELYRSLLAERRVLVVLDNAADEEQVGQLLPGSATCGVLATSRRRLMGLAGARVVELDVLEPPSAVELLGRIVGAARVAAEPEAAAELARLCGHLPLALRIAGARLATRPHWRVGRLVERLADAQRRLDELAYGHLEVRASLMLSYRGLGPAAQVLFRRLGLLEAPDVASWVGAALLDSSLDDAEELLEGLVDAHLMDVVGQDATGQVRYRFHDLVRVFARELAQAEEPAPVRAAALTRAFGAWLALTERAYRRAHGDGGWLIRGDAPRWLPTEEAFADFLVADPSAWLDSERPALVAAVDQARQLELVELCWNLAVTAANVNPTRDSFEDWRQAHQWALAATREAGNRRGEAVVMADLGSLYQYQDRYDEALAWLRRALPLLERVGERHGHAIALTELAIIERLRGRFAPAAGLFEDALAGLRMIGDRLGEAYVLRNLGQIQLDLGRPEAALASLRQALAIARAVGSPLVESQVLYWLGEAHLASEALDSAERTYRLDLEIACRLGDRHGEALARQGLGRTLLRKARHQEAAAQLVQALQILEEANEPYVAGQVLAHLGKLNHARGRLDLATEQLTRALELFDELRTPQWQARTLANLGAVHHSAGDTDAARAAWTQAHTLFTTLGSPEAEPLAAQLRQ